MSGQEERIILSYLMLNFQPKKLIDFWMLRCFPWGIMVPLIGINSHWPLPGCTLPNLGREWKSLWSLSSHPHPTLKKTHWFANVRKHPAKCSQFSETLPRSLPSVPHWEIEMLNEMIRRCWEFRGREVDGIWCDHHPNCLGTRISWGLCAENLQGPPSGPCVTNLRYNSSVKMVSLPAGSRGSLSLIKEWRTWWWSRAWVRKAG